MKAWNHRHPNVTLVWWVIVWVVFALSAVASANNGDWVWAIIGFIVVLNADNRCKYWYEKTGEDK